MTNSVTIHCTPIARDDAELDFAIWQACQDLAPTHLTGREAPPPPLLSAEYLARRIRAIGDELDLTQLAIIRTLTPAQRLRHVLELNNLLRQLVTASIRGQHPSFDADTLQRLVAQRIRGRNARTRV